MTEVEGVIKFTVAHEDADLGDLDITALTVWRDILVRLELLGQDPARYGGLGFGNLSMRTDRGFLVSGTQTGGLEHPGIEAWAEVTDWDLDGNRVASRGRVKPSSESLTHAAIYGLNAGIGWIFHVHSPDIWRRADELSLAVTPDDIAYGTREMAAAVREACDARATTGAFAMGGHEDGVVTFGASAEAAGMPLVELLVAARSLQ